MNEHQKISLKSMKSIKTKQKVKRILSIVGILVVVIGGLFVLSAIIYSLFEAPIKIIKDLL